MQAVALCWNRSWHCDWAVWQVTMATRVAKVTTSETSATAIYYTDRTYSELSSRFWLLRLWSCNCRMVTLLIIKMLTIELNAELS